MSRPRFSPAGFSMVFCCAYVVVFAMNWPLFLYYPLIREFSRHALTVGTPGPAMAWYGLMASAALVALPVSFCMPRGVVERVLRNYLWVIPCVAMLACVFLLRRLFS